MIRGEHRGDQVWDRQSGGGERRLRRRQVDKEEAW